MPSHCPRAAQASVSEEKVGQLDVAVDDEGGVEARDRPHQLQHEAFHLDWGER